MRVAEPPTSSTDSTKGLLPETPATRGKRGQSPPCPQPARAREGKICPFEIRHLGILSVLYLQQMLPKLHFSAIWEFHYLKFSSGPNHGGPFRWTLGMRESCTTSLSYASFVQQELQRNQYLKYNKSQYLLVFGHWNSACINKRK